MDECGFSQNWEDCSDDNSTEETELEIAAILQEYLCWLEIYSITAFLEKRKKSMKPDLTRSQAETWCVGAKISAPMGKVYKLDKHKRRVQEISVNNRNYNKN